MGKIPSGIFSTGLTDNIFNTHRDLVTEAILNRFTDLFDSDGGIIIDSLDNTGLQVTATSPYDGTVNIKAGVAYDKFGQRILLASDDTGKANYVGTVDLSSGIDLSTNKNVKINIDNAGGTQIDCSAGASNTSSVTINEIVANINAAGFGTIAFRSTSAGDPDTSGNYILIQSTTTGTSSSVKFLTPSSADATLEIFGLSESSYPHTYTGGGGYSIPSDSTTYNVIIEHIAVESTVGNFLSGYPTGSSSKYTKQADSYKVTITTETPTDSASEHELLLATVVNNGSALTITDKRGDTILYLRGMKNISTVYPTAPTKVSMTTGIDSENKYSYLDIKWNKSTSDNGIRSYIIKLSLLESSGITQSAQPETEYMYQSFDPDASELNYRIELPQGYKYNVKLASIDNSVNQNISSYTDFGDILIGASASATLTMTNINLIPINGGVMVDWADVEGAILYEYVYTLDNTTPSWDSKVHETNVSEFTVLAEPGTNVKVRVRTVDGAMRRSTSIDGEAIAGGVQIGDNEKLIQLQNVSVANTADGKTARELGRLKLPNNATIKEIALNVQSVTLNNAERGLVRIWRDNAESDASNITFSSAGASELELDMEMTPGWIIVDAYDSNESGTNQSAFTVDVFIIYTEGKTKGKDTSPQL